MFKYFLSRACKCEEQFKDGVHTYTFTGPCVVTGKPYSVTVLGRELYNYHQGALIQDAFPNLSIDDREFLMSGMSPEAWAGMPKEEDYEDEEEAIAEGADDENGTTGNN